jgi:hypothetical protein
MPKYVLTPEYLAELKHFLGELTSEEHKTIISVYLRLCSDYMNNTLSGKSDSYILPKSTAFIVRANNYGERAHLFTRAFDEISHRNKALNLGIVNFDQDLWKAVKDKHQGQSYSFSVYRVEDGVKIPHQGKILFRTKSAKQKHMLHPDELHRIKSVKTRQPNKSTVEYKTCKFIPKGSLEPIFYKKKSIK